MNHNKIAAQWILYFQRQIKVPQGEFTILFIKNEILPVGGKPLGSR
jgi:hypothetical protein